MVSIHLIIHTLTLNMVDLIKQEINKDNPDWLLISNLAQKL